MAATRAVALGLCDCSSIFAAIAYIEEVRVNESVNTGAVDAQHALELGAWVLPISASASVAVGRYELKHIEFVNTSLTLPCLPAFCEQGFLWRNQFVPLLDLHSLISRRRMTLTAAEQLAAIIAYETAEGALAVGAILLRGVPRLIRVTPAQSMSVNELAVDLQRLAHAAFKDEKALYPVLDLRALFDKSPAALLALH
jgi:chemotaxis signal transduction protein